MWTFKKREEAAAPNQPIDPYDQGMQAARDGIEFWMNPYTTPTSSKRSSDHWFAGWCCGKKHAKDSS